MECPKCHKKLEENATVCPHCHKVIALVCPNCKTIGQSPVCEQCGYTILTKCVKCGKLVATNKPNCKCGFPIEKSIACHECETDEFASMTIRFLGLNQIKRQFNSIELYKKFTRKLRNLLISMTKGVDGKIITYDEDFVINFNKDLSFPTSAQKAIRLALKVFNAFTVLNKNVIDEITVPLRLNISITKKKAEDLLKNIAVDNKTKQLGLKKTEQRYLRGMQLIIDQFVFDTVSKEYASESLYSVEKDGQTLVLYEVILDKYVLPPNESIDDEEVKVYRKEIEKKNTEEKNEEDLYSFKVFDIKAECKFRRTNAMNLLKDLDDNKIISIRSEKDLSIKTSDLIGYYEDKGKKVLRVVCTESGMYRPWNFFDALVREFYNIPMHNSFVNPEIDIKPFASLQHLLFGRPRKAASSEDARFAYMEDFCNFLSILKNCVVIVENFEQLDDSTIQTLSLYFDSYKNIIPDFVFITDDDTSLHSKIKNLLRTHLYTEFLVGKTGMDVILSEIKEDAADFINSFYFEKIKENFDGSLLYFDNAVKYLEEKDVLLNFENKLLIKNNMSVLLPINTEGLIKERLKVLGKNQDASLIMAYSVYLGYKINFEVLKALGVNNIEDNCKILEDNGFAYVRQDCIYINNYSLISGAIMSSMKKETEEYLCKNIISKIGQGLDNSTAFGLLGVISMYNEEYLFLWKNSQYAMAVGDYDAYLKNCLGFLSLIGNISGNISQEDIEEHKKEVYQNILMALYGYSPEKIYSIEHILLNDAMARDDKQMIIKLSNFMLQGALLSANYTDALTLMHNILTRIENPMLVVDGAINTKFLLLSLVNMEISFSTGNFKECIEIAEDILNVIKYDIIEQIVPPGFSKSFFITHLMESFKIAALAKIIVADNDLNEYFEKIHSALNEDLYDKGCMIALRDFLSGKTFAPSNVEEASSYEKLIYMLIQLFAENNNDYKKFAQNCYQAKLLASDIHQTQLERLCDVLIAYSYSQIGIKKKAYSIYKDVIDKSKNAAVFNSHIIAKYFMARQTAADGNTDEAMHQINDSLAMIQRYDNQAKVFYAMFEKLFIEIAKTLNISSIDIESEEQRLATIAPNGELYRITGHKSAE